MQDVDVDDDDERRLRDETKYSGSVRDQRCTRDPLSGDVNDIPCGLRIRQSVLVYPLYGLMVHAGEDSEGAEFMTHVTQLHGEESS